MAFAFIKHDTKIDFIGKRHIAYVISILLLLVGLGSALWGNGLRMGIDFAGGVIVQVQFAQPVEDEVLKKSLDVPELPGISTQRFGEGTRDYLLRFSSAENTDAAALRTNVLAALAKAFPGNDVEIQRLEIVGPKVGDDLTNKALGALYYATLLIAVYISGRFEQRWMAGVAMAAVLWGGMYLAGLTGLSMGAGGPGHHPGGLLRPQAQLRSGRPGGPHPRRVHHGGPAVAHERGDRPQRHGGPADPGGLLAQRHHHRL